MLLERRAASRLLDGLAMHRLAILPILFATACVGTLETGEPSETVGSGGKEVGPPDPIPNKPVPTVLKDALTQADVDKGLSKLKSKVSACKSKGGLPGMKIQVNFLIAEGKVKSASARPPHTSTPVGKCVADVVKAAKFTKAKQSKIVDHTFSL